MDRATKGAIAKDEITRLYWEEELTQKEVATKTGLCYQTVQRHLAQKRSLSEAQINRQKHHPTKVNKPRIELKSGYIKVYQAGEKGPNPYEYEHRLVWEEYHQKKLPKGWVVHHLNGIRSDNRPENLLGMPKGKHGDIIPEMAKKLRQLEIENRQLRRAFENSQSIFYLGEN